MIAGAARWARRDTPADERLARALLGVLCALTLVMLASALRRLGLYEDAYGATRLRALVHVQLLWLGAVFALLLLAGGRAAAAAAAAGDRGAVRRRGARVRGRPTRTRGSPSAT